MCLAQAEYARYHQRLTEQLYEYVHAAEQTYLERCEKESGDNERKRALESELREARVNLFELRTNSISVAHGVLRFNRRFFFVHALREVAFVGAHQVVIKLIPGVFALTV